MPLETIAWEEGRMKIIDQTKLPSELVYVYCDTLEEVWEAIKALKVRGAPAIGIAGALGVLVGMKGSKARKTEEFISDLERVIKYLASSRPTAVNLFWALERMRKVAMNNLAKAPAELYEILEREALTMIEEDRETCRSIGKYGSQLLKSGDVVLTH